MGSEISVLRLGHRPFRDKRVSTHVALVARAFGASKVYYSGTHDSEFETSIGKIVNSWGGPFEIEHVAKWRKFIQDFKGETIHLTMYGLPYAEEIPKLSKTKPKLIIVGGAKVPMEVYHMVEHNLAVTSQPHSEIAALAVFLEHAAEKPEFKNARQQIVPKAVGKEVMKNG